MIDDYLNHIEKAAVRALTYPPIDWTQVQLNLPSPPCFHVEAGRFCLRAAAWAGHTQGAHPFVDLVDLLRGTRQNTGDTNEKDITPAKEAQ